MESAEKLSEVSENEFEKEVDSKIIDITAHNGSKENREVYEDPDAEYEAEYAALLELLKKANMVVRTYGAVYFISFVLSAWVSNRMFDFAVWQQNTESWYHPLTELCIVFTSVVIGYVCISMFWRYLFVNIANIDDALTIRKLHRLWWLRAIYVAILGFFLFLTWKYSSGWEGGTGFAAFVSVVFGAQILFFGVCEVFFQKLYRQLKKY